MDDTSLGSMLTRALEAAEELLSPAGGSYVSDWFRELRLVGHEVAMTGPATKLKLISSRHSMHVGCRK